MTALGLGQRWRLVLACSLAILAIGALELWLRRANPARAPAAGPAGAAVPLPVLPPGLRAGSATIGLFADVRTVPAAAGPVVQILADGTIALRRGAPPARGPRAPASHPAVVLPTDRLAALSPSQRLALLELLGALWSGRPVPPERCELVGVAAREGEVAQLLSWVP
jgi:hypothetical protein